VQHSLDGFCAAAHWFEFQGEGDRLTPEVGCCGAFPLIAPPRVADQALAGERNTGKRLDIVRFTSESRDKPSLRLGSKLGLHPSPECSLSVRETFSNVKSRAQSGKRAAARLVQEQNVKHLGDLPGYRGLDCCQVFRPKFLSTRPQVISRYCVRDANVDPQLLVTAPLNTPINHVAEFGRVSRGEATGAMPFLRDPS